MPPPLPPPRMDDDDDADADDEAEASHRVLGPPHQPSQSQQDDDGAFVFDHGMVYDGRPLVSALLYLAGRIARLPDYDKVCGR